MNLMMTFMFSMSMSFFMMSHPLSMGFNMLMLTILISLMTGLMNSTFWFSYIMFLVMIGGMLILFIYMTSVASNEKFKFSIKIMINMILSSMMFMMTLKNYQNIKLKEINNFNEFSNIMNMNLKYFTPSSKMILISAMIYLLITLLMTVAITKKNLGPLRQKN
uniref:NADH-ubiquinone oxidoreductase chain 6 n=1 Tax=Pseudocolaspis sp. PSE01 TaxID=1205646 RepID=A0A0S2MP27_9CUCU|nr:NADH deshydrogenase subunit 6 [Pseudocolaspis sp. PSE01]